ncbi:TPA: hypothetical protein QDB43_000274 [Burkholderia vietnamiensis]|nr:hypothetical protein [Burkholderia vietnamiensis]
MLLAIEIVAAVLVGLFVLFVVFGKVLHGMKDRQEQREAHDAESFRLAEAVALAEANKAKPDQAVLDALATPLVGDGTRH